MLAECHRPIPRTHDLLELMDMVSELNPDIGKLEMILLSLNDYSVIVRYPTHITLEERDAVEALDAVVRIREVLMIR